MQQLFSKEEMLQRREKIFDKMENFANKEKEESIEK